MEANEYDARQQATAENASTRTQQNQPSQEGYTQQTVPPGYGPGQPPGMGPYGPYQPPAYPGPGPAPGMGMYGPGPAPGAPPYGPGSVPGTPPYMQAHAGSYAWPYYMAGPAYPPSPWAQVPYFGPPGPQSHGPYAGQASGESATGMDGLMRDVMNGNVSMSSLTQWLGLGDKEFWKGALVGAALVLLLTSESIKQALFGARGTTAETSPPDGDNV